MSSSETEYRKLLVELMRRGATLLREPCPKCGGLMLKYKGVSFCPRCWGVKSVEEVEEKLKPPEELLDEITNTILGNLRGDIKMLQSAKNNEERRTRLHIVYDELQVLELVWKIKNYISSKSLR